MTYPQGPYAPPPGGAPGGYAPPGGYGGAAPAQSNGVAIAALVCGILSLVCLPPLGLVAVPLGIAGMSKAKKIGGNGRGLAIGGLITGILGILATIVIVIVIIIGANTESNIDSDPSNGVCNRDRFLEDPDC